MKIEASLVGNATKGMEDLAKATSQVAKESAALSKQDSATKGNAEKAIEILDKLANKQRILLDLQQKLNSLGKTYDFFKGSDLGFNKQQATLEKYVDSYKKQVSSYETYSDKFIHVMDKLEARAARKNSLTSASKTLADVSAQLKASASGISGSLIDSLIASPKSGVKYSKQDLENIFGNRAKEFAQYNKDFDDQAKANYDKAKAAGEARRKLTEESAKIDLELKRQALE